MDDNRRSPTVNQPAAGPTVTPTHSARNIRDRNSRPWTDGLRFFGSFLRRPTTIGSVVPSSRALALAMVESCGLPQARSVVELGPGTGPFTEVILEQLRPGTLFLAIELDRGHAERIRERFPGVTVVCDSADRLGALLRQHGASQTDCLLSGLPWASMPRPVQHRIFGAVIESLAPGGVFVAFSYVHARWMPAAKRFRDLLADSFSSVRESRIVWRNFPPAFVFSCTGPRKTAPR